MVHDNISLEEFVHVLNEEIRRSQEAFHRTKRGCKTVKWLSIHENIYPLDIATIGRIANLEDVNQDVLQTSNVKCARCVANDFSVRPRETRLFWGHLTQEEPTNRRECREFQPSE